MRISVIIPTYNSAAYVVEAIESALGQTLPPAEVIVVDDGSRDDTAERLAPYRDRIRYVQQPNGGVASARNHGLRLATGDAVAFLDADDAWHPRKLEVQAAVLAQYPELGLLGTGVFDWPAEFPEVDASAPPPRVVPWERLAVKNYLTTSSILIRREVVERVGGFDPELRGPEDYDLWLRTADVAPVAELDLPLTGYRTVAGSLGRQAMTMEAGLLRILQKLDERGAWRGRWLLRRKAASYCRYSCSYLYAAAGDPAAGLGRLCGSLLWYPLPYRRAEVRMALARPRLFAATLLRWLRARRSVAAPASVPATQTGGCV